MYINDCAWKNLKLCPNSIRVVGENGKTAGVVTNITRWDKLPLNKQSELSGTIRRAGLWGAGMMSRVYYNDVDKRVYFFDNRKNEEIRKVVEPSAYEKACKVRESATKVVRVIPCYCA